MRQFPDDRPARSISPVTCLLVIVLAAPVSAQQAWQIDSGDVRVRCPLTVGGSFTATTTDIAGALTARGGPSLDGVLRVDLRTLDTGIDLRNRHMRDNYLEVARGEAFAYAELHDVELPGSDATRASGKVAFRGNLRLHDVTRIVEGEAELTRDGGRLRVVARFPVRLDAHDVPPPRYLGVGVRDEVRVEVRFEALERR